MREAGDSHPRGSVRYIATLGTDSANPDGSFPENFPVVLDAIPVSVLERLSRDPAAKHSQLAYLLLEVDDPRRRQFLEAGAYFEISVSDTPPPGEDWIPATSPSLGSEDGDREAALFVLLAPGVPKKRHLKTLKQISKFSEIKSLSDFSLFEFNSNGRHAVAVYDVGQASFSAIVNGAEHPMIFFDFGKPLGRFKKSVPPTHLEFAPLSVSGNGDDPTPVVLSHLDWDHWAYAILKGMAKWDSSSNAWTTQPTYRQEALERPWLMRRPRLARHNLGPSHIHFVQKLSQTTYGGNKPALHFWPEKRKSVDIGVAKIFKCAPGVGSSKAAPFLRNNESLGMLIRNKQTGPKILLPGDADYPSIPSFAKVDLSGLVATHHGGKVTPGSVPQAVAHGRLIESTFPNCYSNIPHDKTQDEARANGWRIAATHNRQACSRMGKSFQCANHLIRLNHTPICKCNAVPVGCLCISKM